MNREKFVEAIRASVGESAIEGTLSILRKPPGRVIPPREKALSDWYNALTVEDKDNLRRVISESVFQAVFGFFAVLDGVRTIDTENGRFELTYISDRRVLLNDPNVIDLHDLFNVDRELR